jgi:hypothetical protein
LFRKFCAFEPCKRKPDVWLIPTILKVGLDFSMTILKICQSHPSHFFMRQDVLPGALTLTAYISGVSCAPSPIGTPFFITLSKTRSSQVVTITFFNAGTARAAILAWHYDT